MSDPKWSRITIKFDATVAEDRDFSDLDADVVAAWEAARSELRERGWKVHRGWSGKVTLPEIDIHRRAGGEKRERYDSFIRKGL